MTPTRAELRALVVIRRHEQETGLPPTQREIAALLDVSHGRARQLVEGLRDRGLLVHVAAVGLGRHRNALPTDRGRALVARVLAERQLAFGWVGPLPRTRTLRKPYAAAAGAV